MDISENSGFKECRIILLFVFAEMVDSKPASNGDICRIPFFSEAKYMQKTDIAFLEKE
jgi:hypothetical protein